MNELDKHLHANTSEGDAPRVQHFTMYDAELSWVAEDITRRLKAGQAPSSMAVLARRNQGVQKVHEVLELRDVPHAVTGLVATCTRNLRYANCLKVSKLWQIRLIPWRCFIV